MGYRLPPRPDCSDAEFERWVRSHQRMRVFGLFLVLSALIALPLIILYFPK